MRFSTQRRWLRGAVVVALAAVVMLCGCSGGEAGSAASSKPTFGEADVKFAQTMIAHHEQSTEMSGMVLAKSGIEGDVTQLAQQIKDAQTAETATMAGFLTAWNQPLLPDHSAEADEDHWSAEGILTPEQMQELDAANARTGTLFLKSLIAHHRGALIMLQDQLDNGQNPDAVQLAKTIEARLNAEIRQATTLLDT